MIDFIEKRTDEVNNDNRKSYEINLELKNQQERKKKHWIENDLKIECEIMNPAIRELLWYNDIVH